MAQILLEQAPVDVRTAGGSRHPAWRCSRPGIPTPVITDMMLPDGTALNCSKFKECRRRAEVIVISGQGTIPRSVEAGQAGAFDFVEKSQLIRRDSSASSRRTRGPPGRRKRVRHEAARAAAIPSSAVVGARVR